MLDEWSSVPRVQRARRLRELFVRRVHGSEGSDRCRGGGDDRNGSSRISDDLPSQRPREQAQERERADMVSVVGAWRSGVGTHGSSNAMKHRWWWLCVSKVAHGDEGRAGVDREVGSERADTDGDDGPAAGVGGARERGKWRESERELASHMRLSGSSSATRQSLAIWHHGLSILLWSECARGMLDLLRCSRHSCISGRSSILLWPFFGQRVRGCWISGLVEISHRLNAVSSDEKREFVCLGSLKPWS